jgi:hypothetical protein
MKKFLLITLSLLSVIMSIQAVEPANNRHSFRLGWGEAFLSAGNYDFESLHAVIYDCVGPYYGDINQALDYVQGMPAPNADGYLRGYRVAEYESFFTTGHFFAGYQYQFTPVVSFGVDADVLFISHTNRWYNGYHTYLQTKAEELIHITLMPNVRFTYYRKDIVELYSALGVGYTLYDYNHDLAHGLSLNATVLGIRVGKEHWFADFELGSFQSWALTNPGSCGMYGSRLFSLAVGYRL